MAKKSPKPPTQERAYREVTIPGTEITMRGLAEPHPLSPATKPFRFDEVVIRQIAAAVKLGINTMLTGPSGCGKTETVLQTAAVLGRPCVRFNFNGETRVSQLLGQQRPATVDGALSLQFCAGDLVTAVREGYWVFLEEIDMASPSVTGVLHPVLEEGNRMVHIPETGETIVAHEDFHVFASGNTIGERAKHRARFAGTGPLNSALLGRFGMVILCGYPDEEEEQARILCHIPELHVAHAVGVTRVASKLREDGDFLAEFSTRSLIQWAKIIHELGDDFRSFELAILRKLENETDRTIAKKCLIDIFKYADPDEKKPSK